MKRCEEDRLNFIKQNSFYINYKNSKLYGCRNASRKKTNFTQTRIKKFLSSRMKQGYKDIIEK